MEIIFSFEGEEKGRWKFPKNVSKVVFDKDWTAHDVPVIKEIEFYDTKILNISDLAPTLSPHDYHNSFSNIQDTQCDTKSK